MPKNAKKIKKSFLAIGLSLFLVAMLILANYLSALLIKSTDKSAATLSSNSLSIYVICFDRSLTQAGAESLASDYRTKGAGGFVLEKDNYFYVASSAYLNSADAALVQESIKQNHNLDCLLIDYQVPSFQITLTIDSEEKKVLQKALNAHENAYKLLFDIALSLDTNVYNEISARLAINSAFSSINTVVADYKILFGDIENDKLELLTQSLEKLTDTLQRLCSGITISSSQTMSSLIKYRYFEILHQAKILAEEIEN